jgi:ubiquinone/menaquinone biosynthesis C-methylase UbiE
MTTDLDTEIDHDRFRERLLKYTRHAYQLLPELTAPDILDVGCGSGVATLELAKLSDGEIIGIDVNQAQLSKFTRKIQAQGLFPRVKTVQCSLLETDLPDRRFDIIWAEGSLRLIGFEQGLKKCSQLLTPDGFLVIHDSTKILTANRKNIQTWGYTLEASFLLPNDAWWREYYQPLDTHIKTLATKYQNNDKVLKTLEKYQNEVDMVKGNLHEYRSAFYILHTS